MSGYLSVAPQPPRLGARAPGDTDPVLLDWTANLAPVQATIASVVGVTVTRRDGAASGGGDLALVSASLATALTVAISLTGGLAGTDYVIACTILRSDGAQVTRSAYQAVSAPLG